MTVAWVVYFFYRFVFVKPINRGFMVRTNVAQRTPLGKQTSILNWDVLVSVFSTMLLFFTTQLLFHIVSIKVKCRSLQLSNDEWRSDMPGIAVADYLPLKYGMLCNFQLYLTLQNSCQFWKDCRRSSFWQLGHRTKMAACLLLVSASNLKIKFRNSN